MTIIKSCKKNVNVEFILITSIDEICLGHLPPSELDWELERAIDYVVLFITHENDPCKDTESGHVMQFTSLSQELILGTFHFYPYREHKSFRRCHEINLASLGWILLLKSFSICIVSMFIKFLL